MATKKYNWQNIKSDYMANKYPTLRGLADAYGVEYGYMRKRAAKWKNEKEFVSDLSEENSIHSDLIIEIPEDRNELHTNMYDKLSIIVMRMLNEPENFFTHEGKPKTKSLVDISQVVERIQKGHQGSIKDDKQFTQLTAYTDMIKKLKESVDADSLLG
ncbi:hypothetical protein [uncultured Clostridium sp.]|uniref:hypothetical protein n=1 Tax=uncultured Clostridium sp. TaxID=59620 RepID=UPI00266EF18C|nr:hypothetical protein [uncultured Clostridium sp.]